MCGGCKEAYLQHGVALAQGQTLHRELEPCEQLNAPRRRKRTCTLAQREPSVEEVDLGVGSGVGFGLGLGLGFGLGFGLGLGLGLGLGFGLGS